MRFIKLTVDDDKQSSVWVNVVQVVAVYVRITTGGALVIFANDSSLRVTETPEQVMALIQQVSEWGIPASRAGGGDA